MYVSNKLVGVMWRVLHSVRAVQNLSYMSLLADCRYWSMFARNTRRMGGAQQAWAIPGLLAEMASELPPVSTSCQCNRASSRW